MSWGDIRGWFDWEWLYEDMVKTAPKGALLVEVGVCFGRSLAYLGHQAIVQGRYDLHLLGVDPFLAEDWLVRDHSDLLAKHGCALEVGASFWDAFVGEMFEHAPEAFGRVKLTALPSSLAARALPLKPHFVYIDGDHSTEAVERDIDTWLPKLARGGILAGHDFGNFGVESAVRKKFGDAFDVHGSTWMVRTAIPRPQEAT